MFATDRPGVVSYLFVMVFLAAHGNPPRHLVPARARADLGQLPWRILSGVDRLRRLCGGGLYPKRSPDARRLVLVTAAVFLASGLNPNGFGVIPTMLRYRQSYMTSTIIEWRHADLWGDPYGYNILLYLSVPVLAMAWRRVRIVDWLLFAFFAWASLTAFRNEIYLGLFAPILIAGYWPWKRPAAGVRAICRGSRSGGASGVGCGAGIVLPAACAGEWRYPAGAADFLRSHNITGAHFQYLFHRRLSHLEGPQHVRRRPRSQRDCVQGLPHHHRTARPAHRSAARCWPATESAPS